jgi:TfoX/Sxy family transcriptional regulator of competence genes
LKDCQSEKMAYDHDLANRIREQLANEDAMSEKEMFGGIAFLLAGNMAVGVSRDELMVRVGKEHGDEALAEPHTRPFDMTGRPMKAWVLVEQPGFESDAQLADWVARGVAYARSLPPKG